MNVHSFLTSILLGNMLIFLWSDNGHIKNFFTIFHISHEITYKTFNIFSFASMQILDYPLLNNFTMP